MGLNSESAKRERLAAISPESKERAQFENRLAIERELAEDVHRQMLCLDQSLLVISSRH
jgi:hypothetical protein